MIKILCGMAPVVLYKDCHGNVRLLNYTAG